MGIGAASRWFGFVRSFGVGWAGGAVAGLASCSPDKEPLIRVGGGLFVSACRATLVRRCFARKLAPRSSEGCQVMYDSEYGFVAWRARNLGGHSLRRVAPNYFSGRAALAARCPRLYNSLHQAFDQPDIRSPRETRLL